MICKLYVWEMFLTYSHDVNDLPYISPVNPHGFYLAVRTIRVPDGSPRLGVSPRRGQAQRRSCREGLTVIPPDEWNITTWILFIIMNIYGILLLGYYEYIWDYEYTYNWLNIIWDIIHYYEYTYIYIVIHPGVYIYKYIYIVKKKWSLNLVFFCRFLLQNSASNIPITPHQGAAISAAHDAEGTALRRCPGRVDSPNGVIYSCH